MPLHAQPADWLRSKLLERQAVNPRYSLRAFARDLGLTPSRVSEILRGKQGLSPERARAVARALKLSKPEAELFVLQATAEAARSRSSRKNAEQALASIAEKHPSTALSEDQFHVISDWYHFAILELLMTKGFRSSMKWLADRLGIRPEQAQEATERLLRLGLIARQAGEIVSTGAQMTTTHGIPSESIRRFNLQILEKAREAVVHQGVEERDIGTLTVAITPEDLPEIQEFLRQKRRALNRKLAEKARERKPTEVYVLATQFFRLSQPLPQRSKA